MNRLRTIWLILGLLAGVLAMQWRAPSSVDHAPSLAEMTHTINHKAKSGERIELSKHAWQRMGERKMTMDDIRTVLANGIIKQPPRKGSEGDWVYKLEDDDTRGTQDGEVVVIPRESSLFIVTVMWDGPDKP